MSHNSSHNAQQRAFLHLTELKYLMAGDLESSEPINLLMKRLVYIKWNSPEFEALFAQFKAILPLVNEEESQAISATVTATMNELNERNARMSELLSQTNAVLKKVTVIASKAIEASNESAGIASRVLRAYEGTITKLSELGVDTSPYSIAPES